MEEIFEPRPTPSPMEKLEFKMASPDAKTSLTTSVTSPPLISDDVISNSDGRDTLPPVTSTNQPFCSRNSLPEETSQSAQDQQLTATEPPELPQLAATHSTNDAQPKSILSSKQQRPHKDSSACGDIERRSSSSCASGDDTRPTSDKLLTSEQERQRYKKTSPSKEVNWDCEVSSVSDTGTSGQYRKLVIMPRMSQYQPHALLQERSASGRSQFDELTSMMRKQKTVDCSTNNSLTTSKRCVSVDGTRPKNANMAAMAKKQMSLDSVLALKQIEERQETVAVSHAGAGCSLRLEPRGAFHETNPLLEIEQFLQEKDDESLAKKPDINKWSKHTNKPPPRSSTEPGQAPTAPVVKRAFFMSRMGSISLEPRVSQYEKHPLLESRDDQGLSPIDYFLSEKEHSTGGGGKGRSPPWEQEHSVERDEESSGSKGKCSEKSMCKNSICTVCKPYRTTTADKSHDNSHAVIVHDTSRYADMVAHESSCVESKFDTQEQESAPASANIKTDDSGDVIEVVEVGERLPVRRNNSRPRITKQKQVDDNSCTPSDAASNSSNNAPGHNNNVHNIEKHSPNSSHATRGKQGEEGNVISGINARLVSDFEQENDAIDEIQQLPLREDVSLGVNRESSKRVHFESPTATHMHDAIISIETDDKCHSSSSRKTRAKGSRTNSLFCFKARKQSLGDNGVLVHHETADAQSEVGNTTTRGGSRSHRQSQSATGSCAIL